MLKMGTFKLPPNEYITRPAIHTFQLCHRMLTTITTVHYTFKPSAGEHIKFTFHMGLTGSSFQTLIVWKCVHPLPSRIRSKLQFWRWNVRVLSPGRNGNHWSWRIHWRRVPRVFNTLSNLVGCLTPPNYNHSQFGLLEAYARIGAPWINARKARMVHTPSYSWYGPNLSGHINHWLPCMRMLQALMRPCSMRCWGTCIIFLFLGAWIRSGTLPWVTFNSCW